MPTKIPVGSLIDFHSHYYEQAWSAFAEQQGPAALQRAWPLLTDIEGQLAAMEAAGITAKVLSAPSAALLPSGQAPSQDLIRHMNDRLASLVARFPDHLLGLATIDAFQGEEAAYEAERAVRSLGLGGLCIDCALGDRYLNAPEAHPIFVAAAKLDVPIFVHPVSPPGLTNRLAFLGHGGVLMARGTETAASLLALLRSGIFDELPTLKIVFPMIAAAVFLFAGMVDSENGHEGSTDVRHQLYVDTMGFDPASIRFALDLVGAEHVLLGSDWPIMPIASRSQVEQLLTSLQLTDAQQTAILGGNTLRLLTHSASHAG